MPGNFIQFDQMPTAGRNKSTEQQVAELRNYIKGVMDQLRYELRRIGNTETSGQKSRADAFGYPVGSVYISTRETNPTTLFGGVWVRLPDRFLLGAGETYEAGETGGEATHTLTASEMPSHTHSLSSHTHTTDIGSHNHNAGGSDDYRPVRFNYGSLSSKGIGEVRVAAASSGNYYVPYNTDAAVDFSSNQLTGSQDIGSKTSGGPSNNTSGSGGGGEAHNNMPPYLVVYMWERTA